MCAVCGYVTLYAKKDFAGMIKGMDSELREIILVYTNGPSNHMNPLKADCFLWLGAEKGERLEA